MSNNHQDLDALPLPVPTHFRNGVLYAFSADQIRAARREGYELAKREAQEGREPVARVELMQTGGNVGLATRIVEIDDPLRERLRPGTKLYTSPPPTAEGREPVAWRTFDGEGGYEYRSYEDNEDYADVWMKRNPRHKGWVEPLYTSPPPKSDEAMDALIKAARWFADNPDSPKSALGHITEALAALAAQQKGGA